MKIEYISNYFFKLENVAISQIYGEIKKGLGFIPTTIEVSRLGEIRTYDVLEIDEALNQEYDEIMIKGETIIIDSNSYTNWIRVKYDKLYRVFSVTFKNENAFFLSEKANCFFGLDGFLCGYLYNYSDAYFQTTESISVLERLGKTYKIVTNSMGHEIVDVSQNWGRYFVFGGLFFMAAPKIWLSDLFFEIIPKEKLEQFGLIHIKPHIYLVTLFNEQEYPVTNQSRQKQKQFWEVTDLYNTALNYQKAIEKRYSISFDNSLEEYLEALKKKKKR